MEIEKATSSDLEEILALQKLSFRSEAELYNNFNIPPMVQTLKETQDDFKRQLILKVTKDGKIIGSIRAFEKDGTCYLARLMVHPNFQNLGIGTKLLVEMEKLFDTCKRFELYTGYKSEKNIRLYKKVGYRIFQKSVENAYLIYMEKII
jgi:ribosomal protein S18 acetylase RimI-like enzyme